MKLLALDLGDIHTGTALTDAIGMFAHPYKTVPTEDIENFIEDLLKKEQISTIIVGYPKTLKGQISAQTQKIINLKEKLEEKFKNQKWILWDERLSSKQAEKFKKSSNKEDKMKLHSIAATIILSSYLEYLLVKRSIQDL